jgi:uncharacterized protein (TIGR01244 family)
VRLKNYQLFLLALVTGMAVTVAYFAYAHAASHPAPKIVSLSKDVFVTGQIEIWQVEKVRRAGYRTIVDLRPDGEAAGQASAQEIEAEAARSGIRFVYLPVPHGDAVPDQVVSQLSAVIDGQDAKPVLLYCRSGRRATRAWSLAEASRTGGMSVPEILQAAGSAGQPVDDLRTAIAARVEQRSAPVAVRPGESR